MTLSDIIQATGILIALITSTISIILTAISMKRSAKAAEETARAYISLYTECFDCGTLVYYLAVKNYGNSPAQLLNINYPEMLSTQDAIAYSLKSGFEHIKNSTIYPGETKYFPFQSINLPKSAFEITYTYTTCGSKHTENSTIDLALTLRCCKFRTEAGRGDNIKFEKNISYSLQEIAERIAFK